MQSAADTSNNELLKAMSELKHRLASENSGLGFTPKRSSAGFTKPTLEARTKERRKKNKEARKSKKLNRK